MLTEPHLRTQIADFTTHSSSQTASSLRMRQSLASNHIAHLQKETKILALHWVRYFNRIQMQCFTNSFHERASCVHNLNSDDTLLDYILKIGQRFPASSRKEQKVRIRQMKNSVRKK